MALRMMGFHLSDNAQFPSSEDSMYRVIFESEGYWRPHLPVYGLSVVMEILETNPNNLFPGYREILAKVQSMDRERRSDNAANTIRKWCKRILDVVTGEPERGSKALFRGFDYNEFNSLTSLPGSKTTKTGCKFTVAKFMHRAIPEHLISIIRDEAAHYKFHDQDVTEGILIAIIAETSSSYNVQEPSCGRNMALYMQHVLRLLRMRPVEPASNTLLLLDDLERVRFNVWLRNTGRTNSILQPGCQQTFTLSCERVHETDYEEHARAIQYRPYMVWDHSATVLAHTSRAGLYEYMRWRFNSGDSASVMPILPSLVTSQEPAIEEHCNLPFSAFCGLASGSAWFRSACPVAHSETLRVMVSVGALFKDPLDVSILSKEAAASEGIDNTQAMAFQIDSRARPEMDPLQPRYPLPVQWPWISVIPAVLNLLVKDALLPGVWNFLEAWLIVAEMPAPYRIMCGYRVYKGTNPAGSDDNSLSPASRTECLGALTVTYRIRVTYDTTGSSSSNWNDEGTDENIFKGGFILDLGREDWPGDVNHAGFATIVGDSVVQRRNQGVGNCLANCFGSPRAVKYGMAFNEVSLADLVRYHSPPNKDVLLDHLRKRGYDSAVETDES